MSDIRSTVIPKSDQLNADDLIGGRTLTIKVTKVSLVMGEQPVVINYEGDEGKPYKPGKSMRRVLIHVWGADGNNFVGKSMTLYADEKVTFGGVAVGGIRISHMSHIDKPITMALTATRAKKAPFTVKPLIVAAEKAPVAEPASTIPPLEPKIDKPIANDLLGLMTDNGVSPQAFKDHFVLKTALDLPAARLEEAKKWITDNKKEQA